MDKVKNIFQNFVDKKNEETITKFAEVLELPFGDKNVGDTFTPFDMVLASFYTEFESMYVFCKECDIDLKADFDALKEEIAPIATKLITRQDEELDIKYRKVGYMLMMIGIGYCMGEYYQNDFLLKRLEEKSLTLGDVEFFMNSNLSNISKDVAMKILEYFDLESSEISDELIEDYKTKVSKKDLYDSIEKETYKIQKVYSLLEKGDIKAIDIMQNVSPAAYSSLMEKLSQYDKIKGVL